jgi:hypothetical protein
VRPDLRVRLNFEVRQRPVFGGRRPRVNPTQFFMFRRGEQGVRLLHGAVQSPPAQVIRPPFQHLVLEPHREHLGQHGEILLRQLLLKIDGVRADDRLLLLRHRKQDRGHQVGQTLAHARPRLHRQMFPHVPAPAPPPPPSPAAAAGIQSSWPSPTDPSKKRIPPPVLPGPTPALPPRVPLG